MFLLAETDTGSALVLSASRATSKLLEHSLHPETGDAAASAPKDLGHDACGTLAVSFFVRVSAVEADIHVHNILAHLESSVLIGVSK